jgi:hypothetical protein
LGTVYGEVRRKLFFIPFAPLLGHEADLPSLVTIVEAVDFDLAIAVGLKSADFWQLEEHRLGEINAKWGKSFDSLKDYSEWEKSQQERKFSYTESLYPSSWNTVYLLLTPAQREELGYIEVSLDTNVVSLTVR